MSDPRDPVSECDLQSYVDGELDEAQRAEIEALLTRCPQTAALVDDYRRINDALRDFHADVLSEPIPRRLLTPPSRIGRRRRLVAAAVVASLTLGGAGGWVARDLTVGHAERSAELLEYALSAHAAYAPEVRHPVEVQADQEAHLVAWLSKRMNAEVRAPRLGKLGFELLGGRLLPGANKPSAQFMYQDQTGRRLTLYVREGAANNELTAVRFRETGGMRAFYWIDRELGYALVGDLDRQTLSRAADLIYSELNS